MISNAKFFLVAVLLAISISSFGGDKNPLGRLCVIDHIKYLNGDGGDSLAQYLVDNKLETERGLSPGQYICVTKHSDQKVSVQAFWGDGAYKQFFSGEYFPGYRNDNNHAYVEVYCNRAVYFYYQDNQWNSQTTFYNPGVSCEDDGT